MKKLIVNYMLGQFGVRWKELFEEQMNTLKQYGLFNEIEFIDIYVIGKEILTDLSSIEHKINNITYLGNMEEEIPRNCKKYRADKFISKNIWHFCNLYPEYKVLFFHSSNVSYTPGTTAFLYKEAFRKYIETFVLKNWKMCVELLDFYDCVGTDYAPIAAYRPMGDPYEYELFAPHYPGEHYWANASYLKSLDPFFFHPTEEPFLKLQKHLGELWIGSGNPKAFSFYYSGDGTQGKCEVDPPYDTILADATAHLNALKLSIR